MMSFESLIKMAGRKLLLKEAFVNKATEDVHKNFGQGLLSERAFYFGSQRLRVNSLVMESAPGTAEMIIQILKRDLSAESSILDFGCGQHQSQYLKKMGFNVHSCDVIDFKIENFTKINPHEPKLPFTDGQFDVVVASEVLEHVESPWLILNELLRVAKKQVIISTPNPASLKSRQQFLQDRFLYWFAPENFEYHISPIFWWQVELFCQRHSVKLSQTTSNFEAFNLPATGNKIDLAEAFIYKIEK